MGPTEWLVWHFVFISENPINVLFLHQGCTDFMMSQEQWERKRGKIPIRSGSWRNHENCTHFLLPRLVSSCMMWKDQCLACHRLYFTVSTLLSLVIFVASKLTAVNNSMNFEGNFCWWWQRSPRGGDQTTGWNPSLSVSFITLPIFCEQQHQLQGHVI